jgi:hypothetical protein
MYTETLPSSERCLTDVLHGTQRNKATDCVVNQTIRCPVDIKGTPRHDGTAEVRPGRRGKRLQFRVEDLCGKCCEILRPHTDSGNEASIMKLTMDQRACEIGLRAAATTLKIRSDMHMIAGGGHPVKSGAESTCRSCYRPRSLDSRSRRGRGNTSLSPGAARSER